MKNISRLYPTLKKLAEKRGIILEEYADLPFKIKGLWTLLVGAEVISLNKDLIDSDERTFVLAHELGHSFLHRHKLNAALYGTDKEYTRGVEHEADKYAEWLIDKLQSEGI